MTFPQVRNDQYKIVQSQGDRISGSESAIPGVNVGTFASMPAPFAVNSGTSYFATNYNGGALFISTGDKWNLVSQPYVGEVQYPSNFWADVTSGVATVPVNPGWWGLFNGGGSQTYFDFAAGAASERWEVHARVAILPKTNDAVIVRWSLGRYKNGSEVGVSQESQSGNIFEIMGVQASYTMQVTDVVDVPSLSTIRITPRLKGSRTFDYGKDPTNAICYAKRLG